MALKWHFFYEIAKIAQRVSAVHDDFKLAAVCLFNTSCAGYTVQTSRLGKMFAFDSSPFTLSKILNMTVLCNKRIAFVVS